MEQANAESQFSYRRWIKSTAGGALFGGLFTGFLFLIFGGGFGGGGSGWGIQHIRGIGPAGGPGFMAIFGFFVGSFQWKHFYDLLPQQPSTTIGWWRSSFGCLWVGSSTLGWGLGGLAYISARSSDATPQDAILSLLFGGHFEYVWTLVGLLTCGLVAGVAQYVVLRRRFVDAIPILLFTATSGLGWVVGWMGPASTLVVLDIIPGGLRVADDPFGSVIVIAVGWFISGVVIGAISGRGFARLKVHAAPQGTLASSDA